MAVVLVVEDEEQVRVLVESVLDQAGHQALSASSINEALALIQTDRTLDLLFTDIELEADQQAGLVHAGLELAQQARKMRPELPVLYTTGNAVTDGMQALFVEGAHLLPKPYDVSGLESKLQEVMRAAKTEGA